MNPQQWSHGLNGHHEHSQANHHKLLHDIVYPSYKCIHSGTQKFNMDKTGAGKKNIASKHHTILLHAFIPSHAQDSLEPGAT
jgi:hypothetical protein